MCGQGAWEAVKKKGEDAIRAWVDDQLTGTSVTVVLIGAETSERKYVSYEIAQRHKKGNGMLGMRAPGDGDQLFRLIATSRSD